MGIEMNGRNDRKIIKLVYDERYFNKTSQN